MTNLIAPRFRRVLGSSRGFGLLQVLLLIAVMAGLAAIGYLQWRERTFIDTSRQERQALTQADFAIRTFATLEHRLPCIDIDRDGIEDCSPDSEVQKGWLPSVTLRLVGADPGVDVGQLQYLVQRGNGDNNLTERTDSWKPLEYDEGGETFFAMRTGGYESGIHTLTDFCQRLEIARSTPLDTSSAQVNVSPARAVAFALAHPGSNDADGDGNPFDGANAGANSNRMEDPARSPWLADYNDIVLERSLTSLQADLQCQPLMNSINTVALGHDVVAQVADMREDNIKSAQRAVAFAALGAIMTSLEIALAVTEGISDAGNAAFDWATCVASLGIAANFCAAAPLHTGAAALTAGALAASALAVGANVAAAVIAGSALVLADDAATPAQICPAESPEVLEALLDAAQDGVDETVITRQLLEEKRAEKKTELDQALAARNTAVQALRQMVRGPAGASSGIDPLLESMFTASEDWGAKSSGLGDAAMSLEQAATEVQRLRDEIAGYDSMLEDSVGTIARLTREIEDLDVEIANNPSNKEELEDRRRGKVAELDMAKDPTVSTGARAAALEALTKAQSALDVASAKHTAAQSTFEAADSNYKDAYANLFNGATRYAIYDSNGGVIGYGCTTECVLPGIDIDVSVSLNDALQDLLGDFASTAPGIEELYLKPQKLKNELDRFDVELESAKSSELFAINRRDEVQQKIDNPASCNVTGTAVIPMTPEDAEKLLIEVDRKGGTR